MHFCRSVSVILLWLFRITFWFPSWCFSDLPASPLFFLTCGLNFPWHWSMGNHGANLLVPEWSPYPFWSRLVLSAAMVFEKWCLPLIPSLCTQCAKTWYRALTGWGRELEPRRFLTLPLMSKQICFSHCWDHHWLDCQEKQLGEKLQLLFNGFVFSQKQPLVHFQRLVVCSRGSLEQMLPLASAPQSPYSWGDIQVQGFISPTSSASCG